MRLRRYQLACSASFADYALSTWRLEPDLRVATRQTQPLDQHASGRCDVRMPDDFILQWGNPALYETAPPVTSFDDLLRAQAARLCHRLLDVDGAGLAATQVGSLRRMFAFRFSREDDAQVLVNPRVVWCSRETELFHEGCLSFDSVLVAVERPAAVRIVAHDPTGQERGLDCEGFEASLMQHEIDHLDGILTLHRADRRERHRAMAQLLTPPAHPLRHAA